MDEFACFVERLLEASATGQKGLAAELRVSRSTVAQWKRGHVPRDLGRLAALEGLARQRGVVFPVGGARRLLRDVQQMDRRTARGRRAANWGAASDAVGLARLQLPELERKLDSLEASRSVVDTDRRSLDEIRSAMQALILSTADAGKRGFFDSTHLGRISDATERLIAIDPRSVVLLRDRAAAFASYSRISDEVRDLAALYEAGVASTRDHLSYATLLQQYGEFDHATALLEFLIAELGLPPESSRLPMPDGWEQRQALWIRANVVRSWIEDDTGLGVDAFRRCESLLGANGSPGPARLLDAPSLVADLLARQASVLIQEAPGLPGDRSTVDRARVSRGIGLLRQAERLRENDFHRLKIGRAMLSVGGPPTHEWLETAEELTLKGGSRHAYVELTLAELDRREGRILQAYDRAEEAFHVWRTLPFPQGALKALWLMAQARLETGAPDDALQALSQLILAGELATRLHDPLTQRIRRQIEAVGTTHDLFRAQEAAEEQRTQSPRLFERIPLPSSFSASSGRTDGPASAGAPMR